MIADELYIQAYTISGKLGGKCPMEEIAECLDTNEPTVNAGVNEELGANVTSVDEAHNAIGDNRYRRLQHLIDTKFTDENILTLFNNRNDNEIREEWKWSMYQSIWAGI